MRWYAVSCQWFEAGLPAQPENGGLPACRAWQSLPGCVAAAELLVPSQLGEVDSDRFREPPLMPRLMTQPRTVAVSALRASSRSVDFMRKDGSVTASLILIIK